MYCDEEMASSALDLVNRDAVDAVSGSRLSAPPIAWKYRPRLKHYMSNAPRPEALWRVGMSRLSVPRMARDFHCWGPNRCSEMHRTRVVSHKDGSHLDDSCCLCQGQMTGEIHRSFAGRQLY